MRFAPLADHTLVQGPNDPGKNRHWQPVWETYSIAEQFARCSHEQMGHAQ